MHNEIPFTHDGDFKCILCSEQGREGGRKKEGWNLGG